MKTKYQIECENKDLVTKNVALRAIISGLEFELYALRRLGTPHADHLAQRNRMMLAKAEAIRTGKVVHVTQHAVAA